MSAKISKHRWKERWSETMPLETKDMLIGIVMIVFGVLFVLLPNLLQYLVGIGFIIIGLLKFIPSSK